MLKSIDSSYERDICRKLNKSDGYQQGPYNTAMLDLLNLIYIEDMVAIEVASISYIAWFFFNEGDA
jgi:hypothetical protein